jgi:GT2 family glycosyltransferase
VSVSVVVLSHNRPQLLAQALPSLLAQEPEPGEIVVVDNPSPRSAEVGAVVARHPTVRLLRPPENLGFAGGMNVGLRAARGALVFLTEDDLITEPGALATLRQYLEQHPACALCAGLMLNHASGTVRSAGMTVRLEGVFRQTNIAAGDGDPGPGGAPYHVDVVPGAGVFGRRAPLLELGGFRADFFMYYEDVELCARIRRAGWTVDVVPAARVRHFEPPPGPAPPELEFHRMKNLAATYLLHAPSRVLPEFVARYAIALPLRRLPRSPSVAWQYARAWAWVLSHLPSLWDQRGA